MKKIATLALTMPLPPAPDHVTGAQLGWRKRALAEIEGQRPADHCSLADHARVRVLVGIVHGRALVELIQAAMGILVDAGVVAKLSVISDVETRWDKTVEPGRLQIQIAPAVPPLRRIGAATRQRIREKTIDRWAAARMKGPVAARATFRVQPADRRPRTASKRTAGSFDSLLKR